MIAINLIKQQPLYVYPKARQQIIFLKKKKKKFLPHSFRKPVEFCKFLDVSLKNATIYIIFCLLTLERNFRHKQNLQMGTKTSKTRRGFFRRKKIGETIDESEKNIVLLCDKKFENEKFIKHFRQKLGFPGKKNYAT